ncbi:MAG: D-alanyl-D-alanine carboxypeptidase family protein [Rickettsiaceae bacterium]|nr:D-alanyl-D-alanine carboxypeptidase family protein [Rickettsiaceae bacterium]
MSKLSLFNFLFLIFFANYGITSFAGKKSKKKTHITQVERPQSILILDSDTKKILVNKNASKYVYPASLTKLMTLYITFEDLKSGKLRLGDKILVSSKAQNIAPSKLGVKSGEFIKVEDAINALIVKSANDISIALAEHIGGGVEQIFVKRMNKTARNLGMQSTNFENPHGLHHPNQKSTAIDLAKLTLAIKNNFPEYYDLFNQDSFYYENKLVKGHNKVTSKYEGAEGMKTGYTNASGFNLITTAKRGDKSLIGVLTGYPSANLRDKTMMALLDKKFEDYGVFSASDSPKIKVAKNQIPKSTVIKDPKPKQDIVSADVFNGANKLTVQKSAKKSIDLALKNDNLPKMHKKLHSAKLSAKHKNKKHIKLTKKNVKKSRKSIA